MYWKMHCDVKFVFKSIFMMKSSLGNVSHGFPLLENGFNTSILVKHMYYNKFTLYYAYYIQLECIYLI